MNAEAKTLRARLGEIALDAPADIADRIIAAIGEARPLLDRLSAPVEGVELTRYTLNEAAWDGSDFVRKLEQHSKGEWVRHDDATAALAAKEAERADVERTLSRLASGEELQSLMRINNDLVAERDALKAALEQADVAVNAAYTQADAEWRDHMRVAEKQDKIIADWRAQRRAALSPAQGGE